MKNYILIIVIFLASGSAMATKVIIPQGDGNFENGINAWSPATINGHSVSLDINSEITGQNSAKLTVANVATSNSDLQLNYIFSAIKGATYKLRFKAKASGAVNIVVGLSQDRSPFTTVLSQSVEVGTNVNTYEFTSSEVIFSDGMFKLHFYAGDAPAGSLIWIDDVRLMDITNKTTDNMAVNGDFEEGAIFNDYGGGVTGITSGWKSTNVVVNATHTIIETDAISGTRSYQITRAAGNATDAWRCEPAVKFYAHPGEQYNISFEIQADLDFWGDIHTGPIHEAGGMPIGGYVNAVTKANAGDLILSGRKSWSTQTAVVTTASKGYYWFVFQLGWIDFPVAGSNNFLIDNVKIERVTPLPTEYSDFVYTGSINTIEKLNQDKIILSQGRQLIVKMEKEQLSKLVIYNMYGLEVFNVQINGSTTLELPNKLMGIYIAKLQKNNRVVAASKLIVK